MYSLTLGIAWPVMFAFGIALLCTWALLRAKGFFRILDHPNHRSLHSMATPRTGGFAIWLGSIVGIATVCLYSDSITGLLWIVAAALLVGIVSFLDDYSHIPITVRLAFHLFAGILLLFGGVVPEVTHLPGLVIHLSSKFLLVSSLIYCVWMINLYNFMDGMDGFAGGMTVFGFGTMGLLGMIAGNAEYAALCWSIAAAAAGFLMFNFPPARIFMGDTGSSVLGLMAAALSLWADTNGLFPLWISLFIFSPFIVDASVTLTRRTIRGEKIWVAHRSHYYQRLVQAGWGHKKTVIYEYGLMTLCSVLALAAIHMEPAGQWLIIVGIIVIYVTVILWVEKRIGKLLPD